MWAEDLMANRRSLLLLWRLHRTTAIRIVRGYRTISYVSASVLAASFPFELQALAPRRVYQHLRGLGSSGLTPPVAGQVASDVREEARMETWERWHSDLLAEDAVRAHRGVRAVLSNWEAWRDRGGLPLTFRMTQVLTGHEAFGKYLLRIQREITDTCDQCQEEQDTAQHALELCPAWADQRRVLARHV
ncbi:uncharacterized protein LOC122574368 [Bombus pyrosoma]|uniref:uncharacterized protein LOC122574368 n=1 Tax=Bombus pyrosoma TaxID=396416 RepID=UPI001CB8C6FC|nr:uncharacterized protein LOC122574368 [Bombus pyrosoma]